MNKFSLNWPYNSLFPSAHMRTDVCRRSCVLATKMSRSDAVSCKKYIYEYICLDQLDSSHCYDMGWRTIYAVVDLRRRLLDLYILRREDAKQRVHQQRFSRDSRTPLHRRGIFNRPDFWKGNCCIYTLRHRTTYRNLWIIKQWNIKQYQYGHSYALPSAFHLPSNSSPMDYFIAFNASPTSAAVSCLS